MSPDVLQATITSMESEIKSNQKSLQESAKLLEKQIETIFRLETKIIELLSEKEQQLEKQKSIEQQNDHNSREIENLKKTLDALRSNSSSGIQELGHNLQTTRTEWLSERAQQLEQQKKIEQQNKKEITSLKTDIQKLHSNANNGFQELEQKVVATQKHFSMQINTMTIALKQGFRLLLEQVEAITPKALPTVTDLTKELSRKGHGPVRIHVYQDYRECASLSDKLSAICQQQKVPFQVLPIKADDFPSVQANTPSRTLLFSMFTSGGRWVDDLRGKVKPIQELFKAYENIIVVTLRNTANPSSLPPTETKNPAITEILDGKSICLTSYLLFKHDKQQFYDENFKEEYAASAVAFNAQSFLTIQSQLFSLHKVELDAFQKALEIAKHEAQQKEEALKKANQEAKSSDFWTWLKK